MTRAAALAALLLLAACAPGATIARPHLGCAIGAHQAALGPGVHLGPAAPDPIDAIRGGAPIVCAATEPF